MPDLGGHDLRAAHLLADGCLGNNEEHLRWLFALKQFLSLSSDLDASLDGGIIKSHGVLQQSPGVVRGLQETGNEVRLVVADETGGRFQSEEVRRSRRQ